MVDQTTWISHFKKCQYSIWKFCYTAEDVSKSTEFLKQAVRDASRQLDSASYEIVVTKVARRQTRISTCPPENTGIGPPYSNTEPTASAIKKQRVESCQAPVRISNSKLINEDPNKLNGVHMKDMYTVAPVQQTKGYVPLHRRTSQQELQMREHVKRHYNMCVTLTLEDSVNPVERRTRIKEWMQVVHMIDNTFLVYKFDGNDDDDPISSPDHLPQEENDFKPWFVDRRVYLNKFCFLVRTSGTSNYSYLRGKLFNWNSARGKFIQFDTIKAKRVVPVGWFSG